MASLIDSIAHRFFSWLFLSRRRIGIAHTFVYFPLRLLFGLHVEGEQWVTRDRPMIVAFNHGSHYDGLFMLLTLYRILGYPVVLPVYWSGILDIPVAGAFLRALGGFAISHEDNDNGRRMDEVKRILDAIASGSSIIMNPEGRRNDQLGDFHSGMALLSLVSGCLILPCSLCGVQPLYKDLPFPSRLRGNVKLIFHPPIDPKDYYCLGSLEDAKQLLTKEVRLVIASALDYPLAS